MTDKEWNELLKEGYDKLAAELIEEGWAIVNKGMSFCEHFTHPHQQHPVQIRRKLGSSQWYVTRYETRK